MRSTLSFVIVLWAVGGGLPGAAGVQGSATDLVNLARRARVTASASLNDSYRPRFVADGIIPPARSRDDAGRAWCLPRGKAAGAWLRLQWEGEVSVAAVVYWGRTAYLDNENFDGCEVVIGDGDAPLVSRRLERGSRPQVMVLPRPVRTRSLTLRFPGHYGGPNPGAAEIGVFATVPNATALAAHAQGRPDPGRNPGSTGLLRGGGLPGGRCRHGWDSAPVSGRGTTG